MFDKVVFAGGGHRCWWQAGFWDRVSGEIELHPRVIGGVSFGAITACLLYAGDSKRALAWYERELKSVRSNFNWLNLMRRGRRLMPNAAIQRKALRALLGGENFRQLMWRAPEIRVRYVRLPEGASPSRAVLGALARGAGRTPRGMSPADTAGRFGATIETKRVQDCRSERELVDLLVAASSAPPFTLEETLDGAACFDAGLFDELPIGAVADGPGQTLVLATRHDPAHAPVFARDGFVYVQPSEKVAVASWDYTSAKRYRNAYDLGQRDGEAFLRTFALGQYCDADGLRLMTSAVADPVAESRTAESEVAESEAADVEAAEVKAAEVKAAEAAEAAMANPDEDRNGVEGRDTTGGQSPGKSAEKNAQRRVEERAGERGGKGAAGSGKAADAEGDLFPPMHATDDAELVDEGVLDVSAKLRAYKEPTDAGTAEDLRASQPAASEGQVRSGRSLRASNT